MRWQPRQVRDLFEPFDMVRCFRRCSAKGLSTCLILNKGVQLLMDADATDICEHTKQDVAAAFSAVKRVSADMDLNVNKGKTKYRITDCS